MGNRIDIKLLRHSPPVSDLPRWQLKAIEDLAEPIALKKGAKLIERGTDDGFTYFLTAGKVSLQSAEGPPEIIEANTESARKPLANLRPRILNVKTLGRAEAIRIPDLLLKRFDTNLGDKTSDETTGNKRGTEASPNADQRLPFELYRALKGGDSTILPSLPDTAVRIQLAIDDDISDADAIARLIETDPAITAKVMKTANSAFYGRQASVETCNAAVVRLGLKTTRQLVLAFAIKEVFRSKNKLLRQRMKDLWEHSVSIAVTCFVLAREVEGVSPEEALLVGLIHDVGTIAIINYAARYPELTSDPDTLERIISDIRGELGALILRNWRFSTAVAIASRDAEHWLREHEGSADITDVLIVAQIHDRLRRQDAGGLPEISEIPAFMKVLGEDASPEKSMLIMSQAQVLMEEMRRILRH